VSFGIDFSGADALATLGSFFSMASIGLVLVLFFGATYGAQLIETFSDLWRSK
jgi:hypothetical protein